MAYDFRRVSSHGDEQAWTSSIHNEEDKVGLVANATNGDNADDRCNSFANSLPSSSSQEGSKLNFRNAIHRKLSGDENKAQPLPCQRNNPDIKQDDRARYVPILEKVNSVEVMTDGAYSMRKAKSCPISSLYDKHSKKKRSMFRKGHVKNALFVSKSHRKRCKGKGLLQVKASDDDDDESTGCMVATATADSYSDNSCFSGEEKQKRRCDPWLASLIMMVSLILGLGAFAGAYFLPDVMGKDKNVQNYEEIEYSPTNISVSPSTGDSTSITFYAMADAPYTDHERENIMPYQMKNLSNTADFLIHLGDLQDAAEGCQEYAYKAASDILKLSSIPVFVVPGGKLVSEPNALTSYAILITICHYLPFKDNDINDCANFEHGKEKWREHFHLFDENWKHDFSLSRWGEIDESFVFVRNRILFFGLNIVGGYPHSDHEWKSRHAEHLHRVKELMTKLKKSFDVVVLLAHASPGSNHEDFFEDEDGLARFVQRAGKPFLHLHGDDHVYSEREAAFGVENYIMISLDCGEIASPIKVEIDTTKENPIKISRENAKLEVECCREGWPLKELS